jgi:hypothetical protein
MILGQVISETKFFGINTQQAENFIKSVTNLIKGFVKK